MKSLMVAAAASAAAASAALLDAPELREVAVAHRFSAVADVSPSSRRSSWSQNDANLYWAVASAGRAGGAARLSGEGCGVGAGAARARLRRRFPPPGCCCASDNWASSTTHTWRKDV